MNGGEIQLHGRRHAFRVTRRRRRTLGLYVSREGGIEVRAPLRCPAAAIHAFLESRRDWLARAVARLDELPALPVWADGERHPYLGEWLTLRLDRGSRKAAWRDGDDLRIRLPGEAGEESVERAVREWYRTQARPLLEQSVDRWFPALALPASRRPPVKIRAMRRRWGSCASHGGINLNLWLLRTPPECIDFVVAHELCHLREFHHGRSFHALMGRVMPDWPDRERRLREHEREHPLG